MAALIIGLIAGLACFLMVTEVKKRLGYDDSLDAFGVHGGRDGRRDIDRVLPHGAVNAILGRCREPSPVGLIDGHGAQVVNQLIAVGITIGLSVAATFVILKVVDLVGWSADQ